MRGVSSAELREALKESGHRLTGPRSAVWHVVSSAGTHLTAEEIARRVRREDPTVNLSSVYRSLSLFSELGLVRESTLGSSAASRWELAHPDDQFHLICVSCGTVEHHAGDLVESVRRHLRDDHRFIAESVELSVSGLCASCARSKGG